MNLTNIKIVSDNTLEHFTKNLTVMYRLIVNNENNAWVRSEFNDPIYIEKNFLIPDFELQDNPNSDDKEIDFKNHITIYEALNNLPRYILCDERFWLWLELDKFYPIVKRMMKIGNVSTIKDHWIFGAGGKRRGIFFGILSRCYFRVDLTVDDTLEDKYELTRWVVNSPERFRNLTWRSFSNEKHLVLGIIKGEKRAVEYCGKEDTGVYTELTKYISAEIGSANILDAISEKDIEEITFNKMVELLNR